MAWTKLKTAAVSGAVILLAAGIGTVAVNIVHTVRPANAPDIQGPWAGVIELQEMKVKSPVMYKITRENGSYHALGVIVTRASGPCPWTGSSTVTLRSTSNERPLASLTTHVEPEAEEMAGTWKVGNNSGPLTLKLNGLPEAFPEPLAERDYASGMIRTCRGIGWEQ